MCYGRFTVESQYDGLNYSLTGIFYDKKRTTQIDMSEPSKTPAEFEDLTQVLPSKEKYERTIG